MSSVISAETTPLHPIDNVVRLLGRFEARIAGCNPKALRGRKTIELLSFLLLHRDRPHHREVLAGTLWPESDTEQSKKYLRQSLWQLHATGGADQAPGRLLLADAEWIQVNAGQLWLDVAQLEEAYARVKLTPGERLDAADAAELERVVPLYRGDLLEGCYQNWCVYERERLKALYLSLLERLLAYCEATSRAEEGVTHGELLLRYDRAHERAHRRLMRLRYRAGDRTGAIRQFERCCEALREEFGIAPGERTRLLYEQLKSDVGPPGPPVTGKRRMQAAAPLPLSDGSLRRVTNDLERSLAVLADVTCLVEDSIQVLRQNPQVRPPPMTMESAGCERSAPTEAASPPRRGQAARE
jgi:DNA-binding SARP family transcriptional activator